MTDTPQTGSILVRRGPTTDREGFTPLTGEVIYDTTNQQLYIGDAQTTGGKPSFGDKIKVDRDGNLTELVMQGNTLFRYNPDTQSLEYSNDSNSYVVASSSSASSTSVLYVSPNGRDDNAFGELRGRSPRTAFSSLNAACREAERIITRSSKGLGPYQKWITYDDAGTQTRSTITSITDVDTFKDIRVSKATSSLDAEFELRSGFRVIGQISGAIGIIEEYNVLAGNSDQLIIKVELGVFQQGEQLKYGNPVPGVPYSEFLKDNVEYPEITIRIESGVYYEHYPIKVPNNTSIKGDELRRVILRPKPGYSASSFAEISFKREARHLGLDPEQVGDRPFGFHYLNDRTQKIYSFADNSGGYNDAYGVLSSAENKETLKTAVIDFITSEFSSLDYDVHKCRRDLGYIIDAVALDMKHGGYRETLSAGLTYQGQLPSGQITETAAAIDELATQVSSLLSTAAEKSTAEDLIGGVAEIIRGNFNAPKNNDDLDVFLMNDATIIRNITCQGHGGFMEVLDPEGQILTKSPYTQTASSFSKSKAPEVSFAGGMFVDGFCGNLDATIVSVINTTRIVIGNVFREPQTPTSFYINGTRYQINKIDTVGVSAGQYRVFLSSTTPWTLQYYQFVNSSATELPTLPYNIEILTAGNISMLSNDFTQINDLGYGLYTTNNARAEAVSVFCYYCHISYLAENGSDIRSLNGSTAYGDFALVARGSDPLEVSDEVYVAEDMVQIATIITTVDYPNERRDTVLYVTGVSYAPFNISEIEIDHNGSNNVFGEPVYLTRYEVTSVSAVEGTSPQVYSLNIAVGAADNPGIQVDIPDGIEVVIRANQVLKYENILDVNPTRPSTALVYDDDPNNVYRVLSYDVVGLPSSVARITLRESYDYVKFIVDSTAGSVPNSGGVNDTTIRLDVDLDENEKTRILGAIADENYYIFGFDGIIHEVRAYRDRATTGQLWAEIDINPALTKSFAGYPDQPTLRAGLQAGSPARITVGISTLRCTGHDLLDIGTGSYQTSNYPREIYGSPRIPATQSREVVEEGKGRVFYVTTDQDGNFRVGDFFRVDQGTGTVTFSASIALSNLDGIGFKRGVAISEFSTDDAMTDNASDTVPTESAVRGYVDRRLGLNQTGFAVQGKIGSGFLDLTGIQPMQAALDMANFKIERIATPTENTDAANKIYVENYADSKTFTVNGKSANVDNSITLTIDDINEAGANPTNLFFTEARARSAISASGDLSYNASTGQFSATNYTDAQARAAISVAGDLSYNNATGVISFTQKTDSQIRNLFSAVGDVSYNSATGVFSFTQQSVSNADVRTKVSANDAGGLGSFSYSQSTGVFEYNGPSNSDIRQLFSAGGNLSYNSSTGVFSVSLGTIATQNSNSVTITGGSIAGITDLAIADGGTGASTAANARTNLGLGTIATQNSNSISITGGSISGITDLAIADGGTGASTAANARTNLGLGTIATQNSNSVTITGGSITGITDLAIADGGTGASTAANARTNLGVTATGADTTYAFRANNLSDLSNAGTARTNLGLGSMATQNSSSVSISGGSITGVTYTTLTAYGGGGNTNAVAFGTGALANNQSGGVFNTAFGSYAGNSNTTSDECTFVGANAGRYATTALYSTLVGSNAGVSLTTGNANVGVGRSALYKVDTSDDNTALGNNAGSGITGNGNTAIGSGTYLSGAGAGNTAVGSNAGSGFTSTWYGNHNTFLGTSTGSNLYQNGSNNTCVGYYANPSTTSVSNEFTLGNSSVTSLRCNDQTISSLSDARDKTDIVDNPYGLDFINTVQPRQFKWQTRDGNIKDGTTRLGFIAQELLTAANGNNDVLDLVYESNPEKLEAKQGNLIPILVQAVKELSEKCDSLQAEINQLKGG